MNESDHINEYENLRKHALAVEKARTRRFWQTVLALALLYAFVVAIVLIRLRKP